MMTCGEFRELFMGKFFPASVRHAKVLRPNDIYKFLMLLPKDYYLILGNNAKNLLRPFFICMKRWNCSLL